MTSNGKQRFYCKNCCRRFISDYTYSAYNPYINSQIIQFTKEGLGIQSISKILNISTTTALKRILSLAGKIKKPLLEPCKEYELDELCTYIGKRTDQVWVVYAIRKDTKQVADCILGSRSNKVLSIITDKLIASSATRICTDKLLQYKSLIPPEIHVTKKYSTNYIERKNLTLRTHLKRLNRKTICFSKSIAMLHACLTIYFFG